jgi:methionyl-tRNA formyltransferase
MESPRVYFLGSGEIAVPVLQTLVRSKKLKFIGVGTQIDRPAGRKCRLVPTPVGQAAETLGIKADKIPSVNAPEYLQYLRDLEPDIILVVSFGQLLKQELLDLPTCACVNIHASLLPAYRGASPIVSAMLAKEKEVGMTFMEMVKALDAGPMYAKVSRPLTGDEFAGPLEIEMGELAAEATEDILLKICSGELKAVPQDEEQATFCKKIKKSDGIINWNADVSDIDAKVRAYTPWPGAKCSIGTEKGESIITISRCRMRPELTGKPGEFLSTDKKSIIVGCGSGGALEILEVIPSGGKNMAAAAFRNGLRGVPPVFLLPDGSENDQ